MNNSSNRQILFSNSEDASVNLAIEESLLAGTVSGQEILFLYENAPAIVIGRFQNPWKECRTGLAGRLEVPILRRVSGGGTVVHDRGNLNFSVISGSRYPDKEGNLDLVIHALGRFGLDVFRNDRLDLRVHLAGYPGPSDEGAKVSGSAFRQTSGASMHHATLLVDADLDSLRFLLRQPPRNMAVRGVASVPSPVANLSGPVPGLTVSKVADAISREWGGEIQTCDRSDFEGDEVFTSALQRLNSPEWIWEKTPSFEETFTGLADYPDSSLALQVNRGRISGVPALAGFLEGCWYRGDRILDSADGERPPWLEELARRVDGDG